MTGPTPRRTDEELCEAYRAGHEGAFTELVARYKDVLTNCARRLGASDETPVLNVLVRFHERPPSLGRELPFFEWAYRELLRCVSQRNAAVRFSVEASTPRAALALAEELAAAGAYAERPGADAQLQWALQQLPYRYRQLIVLHEIQGLDLSLVSPVIRQSPRRTANMLAKALATFSKVANSHTSLLLGLDKAAMGLQDQAISALRVGLREMPWINAPWHFEASLCQVLMDRQDARVLWKRWTIRLLVVAAILALAVYVITAIARHPHP
jgi:DNA-directed RNA polymerase specialized sigma24 family protein